MSIKLDKLYNYLKGRTCASVVFTNYAKRRQVYLAKLFSHIEAEVDNPSSDRRVINLLAFFQEKIKNSYLIFDWCNKNNVYWPVECLVKAGYNFDRIDLLELIDNNTKNRHLITPLLKLIVKSINFDKGDIYYYDSPRRDIIAFLLRATDEEVQYFDSIGLDVKNTAINRCYYSVCGTMHTTCHYIPIIEEKLIKNGANVFYRNKSGNFPHIYSEHINDPLVYEMWKQINNVLEDNISKDLLNVIQTQYNLINNNYRFYFQEGKINVFDRSEVQWMQYFREYPAHVDKNFFGDGFTLFSF